MISEQEALECKWYVDGLLNGDRKKYVFADSGELNDPMIQRFLREATARRVAEDHNKLLEMGV